MIKYVNISDQNKKDLLYLRDDQIKDCIQDAMNPKGVAVVIEAQHLCMQMRGVQKQNSITTSSSFSGIFMSDEKTRSEFMNLIK